MLGYNSVTMFTTNPTSCGFKDGIILKKVEKLNTGKISRLYICERLYDVIYIEGHDNYGWQHFFIGMKTNTGAFYVQQA